MKVLDKDRQTLRHSGYLKPNWGAPSRNQCLSPCTFQTTFLSVPPNQQGEIA